jgi:hypothetical protein
LVKFVFGPSTDASEIFCQRHSRKEQFPGDGRGIKPKSFLLRLAFFLIRVICARKGSQIRALTFEVVRRPMWVVEVTIDVILVDDDLNSHLLDFVGIVTHDAEDRCVAFFILRPSCSIFS